jgi:N-acetylglutamate synthase-like GNAT family acetyltransferase
VTVEIQKAKISDCESLVQLINDAYWKQQEPFFLNTPLSRERITPEGFLKILRSLNKKSFVLINHSTLLGVIALEIEPEGAKLALFAIQPELQGKKLGELLLQHAEREAVLSGKKSITIDVLIFAKPLIHYYMKHGYSLTGKYASFFHAECLKPEYQRPDQQYLVEMTKQLPQLDCV